MARERGEELRPSAEAVERARTAAEKRDGTTRQDFLRRAAGGIVGASSLSMLLAACGSDGPTPGSGPVGKPPASPTGSIRVAIADYPLSLDPTLQTSVAELTIANGVFESLVAFSTDYDKLVPALATKWETLKGAREWRFTLRQGVKFHDGEPFNSTAVRKNIEYILRKGNVYGFLIGAPKIDDSDPNVVVFRYADPYPDLAHNLTFASSFSSPKTIAGSVAGAEKRAAKIHAGTGPFRFVDAREGQSVTVEAFDGYWGPKAHIKRIEFVKIADESARVSALQAGDVDLVMQVAPLAARSLRSNSKVTVHEAPTWTTVFLMTVFDQKPFDDLRVRQAMAHAIDRKTLVQKVLLGEAVLDDSMFPPDIPGYHVPSVTYDYDPDKSRALLKQAGYDGKVPVRLSTRSDQVLASEISQALAAQLSAAGFSATSDVLDIAVYGADTARPKPKYQLHWSEWGWVTGGPFHLTLGALAAQCHYSSKEYDALVKKVISTADGPEREQLISQAIEIAARDVPWLTLWVPKRLDASTSALQGYQPPPNVSTRLGTAYLAGS